MITFLNVFHVDAADQQRVVDVLTSVTRGVIGEAPGFVSSTLFRSVDGTRVTMQAQWESLADYEAMRRDASALAALAELSTIARFDPGLYELVAEFIPTAR